MTFSYERALAEIHQRSAAASGYIANPFLNETLLERGLSRSRALLAALGSPHGQLRIVHVAGSKGKGSTAAFIANMLADAGLRTGLTTSPHLHTFRERMTIDGQAIAPHDFGRIAERVLDAASRIERDQPESGQVTAFEMLVGMALLYFAGQGCDFAVVEVGLGGRFDSTNVVQPEVSVITTLELEHTTILGPTIQDIAWNKGGIIKPGVPVVSSRQEPEAALVLQGIADSRGARLMMGDRDWRWQGHSRGFSFVSGQANLDQLNIQLPGAQQAENAATAIAAVLQLAGPALPPDPTAIQSGLRRTTLPGRFEIARFASRQVVLDGAHTPASMRLLIDALGETRIENPVVIAGFLQDKEIATLVAMLASYSSSLYLTPLDSPRGATLDDLSNALVSIGSETAIVSPAFEQAWDTALRHAEPLRPIVITGSMTIVARARELLCLAGISQ